MIHRRQRRWVALSAGYLLVLAAAMAASAADLRSEATEERVAAWAISKGGSVVLHGSSEPISAVTQLPAGEFRIHTINLLGTLVEPKELARLRGLGDPRALHLPGTMWNPVCCGAQGKIDVSDELGHLAGLTSLESLHLSHHFHSIYKGISIFDHAIEKIAPLVNLTELRLKYCRVTGANLKPFRKLRWLDLTYSDVNDEGIQGIAGLTNLTKLYLRGTYITDEGLKHIAALENLTELDLDSVHIGDAGLEHLRGLKKLRKLNLLGTDVSDAGLAHLSGLRELEELNIYRTRVTNAGLSHLKGLPRLGLVDLRYSRVTGSGVESLRAALPDCRVEFLDVSPASQRAGAAKLSGKGADAVAKWVRSIGGSAKTENGVVQEISLAATSASDVDIANIEGLDRLQKLDLSATEVSDLGMKSVSGLAGLVELNLSHARVTDTGLEYLAGLKSLRKLTLNYSLVEGEGLARLSGLESLRELHLVGTNISDDALGHVAALENLQQLSLDYTAVSDEGMSHLKALSVLIELGLGWHSGGRRRASALVSTQRAGKTVAEPHQDY